MYEEKFIPNKKPDEQVVFYIHGHWVLLLRSIIFFIAQLLLLGIIGYGLPFLFPTIYDSPALYLIAICLGTLYLLMSFLILYSSFLDYQLDTWIVTNYRIIAIVQTNLFNRRISEHYLDKIQDVSANEKGFLQTLLRYGDVRIQTAGELLFFNIDDVSKPFEIAETINNLIFKHNQKQK